MKALGVVQFVQKVFKLLEITDPTWKGIIGNLPRGFVGIVFGLSGQGKTEFCIQLAKMLAALEKVAWLSYEQGHDYDFQRAVIRNNMVELAGRFIPIDPNKKRKPGKSRFEELDEFLSRRGCPPIVFIDSIDYLRLTKEEYEYIKEKHGEKKGLIFISHERGKLPKTGIGEHIMYDGKFAIRVKDYIATPEKSRIGGTEDYIIWDEKAREKNPLYFQKRALAGAAAEPPKKRRGRPRKNPDA